MAVAIGKTEYGTIGATISTMKKKFELSIDLTDINSSMELDSGMEIACLTKGPYRILLEVCGEVKVYYKGEAFYSASDMPDELRELFHNRTAYEHPEVDSVYNNWFEVFYEEWNGINWNDVGWSDVVDAEGKNPIELEALLEDSLDNVIEDLWLDHAHAVLDREFPDVDGYIKDDFVCEYWQNMRSDEENISDFQEWREER